MTLRPQDFRLYFKSNNVVIAELPKFDRLVFRDALNSPGGWTLQTDYAANAADLWVQGGGPASAPDQGNGYHEALSGSATVPINNGGHGIVVGVPGGELEFGGVMMPYLAGGKYSPLAVATSTHTGTRVQTATTDKHIHAGVSDLGQLGWRIYEPPAAVSDAYPTVTGNPGTVIPDLVEAQVGAAADVWRRLRWEYESTAIAGGSSITANYAWGNLLGTCRDFVEGWDGLAPIVMRAKPGWDETTFSVTEAADSGQLLSIDNAGLVSTEQGRNPSSANRPVILDYDSAGRLVATRQTGPQQTAATGTQYHGFHTVESVVDMTTQPDGVVTSAQRLSAFGGALDYSDPFYIGKPSPSSGRFYRVGELVSLDTDEGRVLVPVAETVTTVTPNEVVHEFTLGTPSKSRTVNTSPSLLYVPYKRQVSP